MSGADAHSVSLSADAWAVVVYLLEEVGSQPYDVVETRVSGDARYLGHRIRQQLRRRDVRLDSYPYGKEEG